MEGRSGVGVSVSVAAYFPFELGTFLRLLGAKAPLELQRTRTEQHMSTWLHHPYLYKHNTIVTNHHRGHGLRLTMQNTRALVLLSAVCTVTASAAGGVPRGVGPECKRITPVS